MTILRHTAPIVRAIHIERFNHSDLWQATFPGDEWTRAKVFAPPLPLHQLKQQLWMSGETQGLPMVVFEDCPMGTAA